MEDALRLVATHIKPDPILYCRLATVSKTFYHVFTSDSLWKFLNPYGCEENIFAHFEQIWTWEDLRRIRKYWYFVRGKRRRSYDFTENLYLRLGALVRFEDHAELTKDTVDDEQLMWCAVNLNGLSIKVASERIRRQKRFALAAVRSHRFALASLPSEFRDDADIVLAAVSQDYLRDIRLKVPGGGRNSDEYLTSLCLASLRLRSDKEIVMLAVENNSCAIKYASDGLKKDRTLVKLAVRSSGMLLEHCLLQGDREIVLLAVQNDNNALQYASNELKADHEVIKLALSRGADSPRKNLALRNSLLQNDRETVLHAVRNDGSVLKYVSPELRLDKEVIDTAIASSGFALRALPNSYSDDRELVLRAVTTTPTVLSIVSERLKSDPEVVLQAIKSEGYGRVLYHASAELINNRDFINKAVEYGHGVVLGAPNFFSDPEIMLKAL